MMERLAESVRRLPSDGIGGFRGAWVLEDDAWRAAR